MTSTPNPKTYFNHDLTYESAHRATFSPPKKEIPAVLPPNLNQIDFEQAIGEFISAVGLENVFVGEALVDYVDPYDVYEHDEGRRKVPSAAVTPSSTEELSSVLKIANKFSLPLWTFSRGKNLGYGGPAPVLSGSVALDLHRMNRILEVNDTFHYAVVEPGVTWTELYEYCKSHGKKVWPSTPSLGWGSVVGNTLDRGTGFGQNFSHHQSVSGMEIMLADGSLIRTGQFGISNSPSAHLSKFTFGPSIEGLFWQSNLGVVTKMSLWLTPQPEAFMSCSFSVNEFGDLEGLVDAFGVMRRDGTITGAVWVGNILEGLSIYGRRNEFWAGEGAIPENRVKELQQKHGLGYWVAKFGLYGTKRIVQAHFDDIKERLGELVPTGTLTGHFFAADKKGELLDASSIPFEHGNVLAGVPSLMALPLVNWPLKKDGKGKPAHGDYAPIIPSSGKEILDWMRTVKPIFEASGNDLMVDFFMHERHVIVTNMWSFDQFDEGQREAVHGLFMALHEIARERGYGMYRGHVQHMDRIAALNDFNDHAYRRLVESIKDTVDPNGILAPGKQGIWPERYRHHRSA
ncbi:FAD-binding oxidoreductase [Aspergillus stella-maris]|uniref:FAD-binding oxidoreductase n=1 Tax=Aspergillus stella-maris TaxID=1810926 RepID=UPI003CCDE668